MRNIKILTTICALVVALSLITTAQTCNRYGGSYAKGVQLFYAEDYAGAVKEFEKAEAADSANHAAYLWHGLTYAALGDLDGKASNVWLKMPYDEKWKNLFRYFMGLGYWRKGDASNARYWFKETQNYPETPAAKLSQTALKMLLEDGEAPPIEVWATLAALPGAKTVKDFENEDEPEENSNRAPNDGKTGAAQITAGAKPGGGLWNATVSNGYKGQTLSFRVSADGKTISDIAFRGYLICRGSRTENTELAPLKSVAISGGAFAAEQLYEGQIRIDFNGTFTSANAASGTYRVMSSTDCDTYKLEWTAARVGK